MRYLAIVSATLLATIAHTADVVEELSTRSQIPVPELEQLLKKCDATQLSMNICSFRDFVEADMRLKATLSRLEGECGDNARKEQLAWEHQRDDICNKEADDEAEGGSMRPMVFSVCKTAATANRFDAIARACSGRIPQS